MKEIYKYNQPIKDILEKRISVRSYDGNTLSDDLVAKIESYSKLLETEMSNELRFVYLDKSTVTSIGGIKLGTYGIIKNAPSFISVVFKNDCSLTRAGYMIQALVCYLTSLGLGTCWLGGTYSQEDFAKVCSLSENEKIRIVLSLGYPSKKRSIISYAMHRKGKRIRKHYSDMFFDNSLYNPIKSIDGMKYCVPLEMLRIAPSAINKQPWAIVKDGDSFHFFKTKTRLKSDNGVFDIHIIDMGIAMFNFEATAIDIGLNGKFIYNGVYDVKVPKEFKYIATWVDLD